MPDFIFDNVHIAGLTSAVPENIQTLDEAEKIYPAQVKSFRKYTGVESRHISLTRQTNLDLGCAAARKIMDKAGWSKDSVDGLIYLTQTSDFNAGTGNSFLAHYILGLKEDCMVFDVPLACSSFPYGLAIAASLLQQTQRLLLISGDTQWHFYDQGIPVATPDGRFMFGEASSAMLLERMPGAFPINISLYTDGSGYKYLFNPLGGARNAWEASAPLLLPNGEIHMPDGKFGYMDGIEITNFSTTKVVENIKSFLKHINRSLNNFDGVVLHQANKQIVKTIARRLGADMTKVPLSLDRYGNTSGASVSLTMTDAYAGHGKDRLELLVSAFGTGLSWGIVSLTLDPAVIEPVFSTSWRFEEGLVRRPGK